MASTPSEAAGVRTPDAIADSTQVAVAWLGARPAWLDTEAASAPLGRFSVTSTVTSSTQVIHLAPQAPETVAELREAHPGMAVVVDVGPVSSASTATLVDACRAEVALVETESDAREAHRRVPELEGKVAVAPDAFDLDWNAPESVLTKLTGAHIKRFRRLHRLAHPMVLFVGPFAHSGGLDVAIAATYRLRDQFADVRLAAVPLGVVDQKYLDRCEMEALALGHRGIIEWTAVPEDRRFWYATATVVCSPWREAGDSAEAPVLAAAAARPFVGSDLPIFRDAFRPVNAPALVEPGDVDALVETVAPLLADLASANALGETARSEVEKLFSYEAAASRLASLWATLARQSPLDEAA